ncbi:MAG: beta-ketoacyl-[acyl-carrier-protein] synthase family protein [Planctomycetaceae bacterium]|nr:beta-ketoacyl-[acyl-carrier-protein] synthase family protein [Planctomycetaceae bacterium]
MDDHEQQQTRIVITGLGVVSSAGCTAQRFWESLTQPRPLEATPGIPEFSGRIDNFGDLPGAKRKFIRKALKLMNRETQMGVAAGQQALADSGLPGPIEPDRIGVCFGADNVSVMPEDFQRGIQACSADDGTFVPKRWGADGIEQIAPLWILKCLPNMPACHLAIINNLRGPSNTITQRDVSANLAISEACRSLRSGVADAVLVGATGTTLTPFNRIHARLENEIADCDTICRPFDRRRTGSTAGEGAGAIVVEKLESAVRRGVRIHGEILGTGSATCLAACGKGNCRQALTTAIRQALRRAGRIPAQIGHIHAHGLATWQSDIAEAQAIREVFDADVACVPVVAAKSQLANSAAGSGMLELIASLLALKHGHLFPVRNYEVADPACPIRPVVDCDESAGRNFLNLNMFGRGLASCVAVESYAA